MTLDKFIEAYERQSLTDIDWKHAMETVNIWADMHSKETDVSPEQIQFVVAMEELGELSQELSKMIRRRGNKMAVLEELADVTLMCRYIQEQMGFSDEDIARALNVKLGRYSTKTPNTENV